MTTHRFFDKPRVLDVGPGVLQEYEDWLKNAVHGHTIVYWTGHLQYDRQVEYDPHDPGVADQRKQISVLNFLANRIRDDARIGHLRLSQKKLGENLYEYRAVRVRARDEYVSPRSLFRDGVFQLA